MITIALQALLVLTLILTGGIPPVRAILKHRRQRRTIRRRLGIVGRR